MQRFLLVSLIVLFGTIVSCSDSDDGVEEECVPEAGCNPGERVADSECASCRAVDNGCGLTVFCRSDDQQCEQGCGEGEYEVFGSCPAEEECVTRLACGEEIVCAGVAECLAGARCPDGSLPLEECPPGSSGCIPQPFCGTTRSCQTIPACAEGACDPGEAPTLVACDDESITFPCREVSACGDQAQIQCVCAAQDLECDPNETFDTEPCVPGQVCREVRGCGQVFYCKGASI